MSDMTIEKSKSKKGNDTEPYDQVIFANDMKCDLAVIRYVDTLTKLLTNDFMPQNKNDDRLVGNKEQEYCGRWYLDQNQVWVGRYFGDKNELCNKLAIGFFIYDNNTKEEKSKEIVFREEDITSIAKVKNYTTRIVKKDGGTWHYIILDDSLKMCVPKAYKKIRKIIWKVIKHSFS